ncbi:MAG: nicotinate phosphoribosyltransferase, partial [Candidatus Hydrogenedentes bacterium]|nr:nicotinate phosphoribosyltransferase [Candidatus Hydrogenedentota bacterium]
LYFRMGLHERRAQFDHFFRSYPNYDGHQAGYCINAGLEWLLDWMQSAHFRDKDIEFMRGQTGKAGAPVFQKDFLEWLRRNGSFEAISMRAIPEGRVVHPNEPLTVVQGPLAMAQILETSLLNHLNYQTLIATKAARVKESAGARLMIEFGMRRGPDRGASAAARAALIGGADFTSNAGASHALGYPPKGTHAHSMVQVFMALGEGELGAFRAYAEVYPDDCLLLVDTIDTLESGIPNAIKVFEELKKKGHQPLGIRLDSGDLAYLSIQAAKMLDAAGFPDVTIFLSNELDEMVIWQVLSQIQASASRYGVDPDSLVNRLAFGVGTRLIASEGEPALNGVYKLAALRKGEEWTPALKVSETPAKTLNPGNKRVWRLYGTDGSAIVDLVAFDEETPKRMEEFKLHHPTETGVGRTLRAEDVSAIEPLHVDILKDGNQVYECPPIEELRNNRKDDVERLNAGVRRMMNPHIYHVSLSERVWELKQELIESFKKSPKKA